MDRTAFDKVHLKSIHNSSLDTHIAGITAFHQTHGVLTTWRLSRRTGKKPQLLVNAHNSALVHQ